MFSDVDTSQFRGIPGVPALLSASEMLAARSPGVSGLLARYAIGLIQNHFAQGGSTPSGGSAFSMLQRKCQSMKSASSKDMERFADALVASAEGKYAVDFMRLAYLCYSAISVFGALPPRVINKISKAEQGINLSSQGIVDGYGGPPQFAPNNNNGPPQFTPNNNGGPPKFTPNNNGPPQFTPNNYSGPPQFTPSNNSGPPKFTPNNNGGPPQFSPHGAYPDVPNIGAGGPPKFNPGGGSVSQNGLKLTEIAQEALQAGAADVAISAIAAAIKEFEKQQ